MPRHKFVALVTMFCLLVGCNRAADLPIRTKDKPSKKRTVEVQVDVRSYHRPHSRIPLSDDQLQDKITSFESDLIHSQPLGGWSINLSEAVIKLDLPMIKPDRQAYLLTLHPSYSQAVQGHRSNEVLPSVNMIDGKAKQFDDGLYAALDQAWFRGLDARLTSHVEFVRRVYEKLGPASQASPFLAAGLELAGVSVKVTDQTQKDALLNEFRGNATASRPIGFYQWNTDLQQCFQFLRFFQKQFRASEHGIPLEIARVLKDDASLLNDYRKAIEFYARLTNPYQCLSLVDVLDAESINIADLETLREEKSAANATVAFFPPSSSREQQLFVRVFQRGLPPEVDLMNELISRVRSGQVDLTPQPDSGWYDYQVYALETLLLPEKGEERNKLFLTHTYKKRMLEAFKARITTRRETHVRQLGEPGAVGAAPPPERPAVVSPRLRVEPCPSYFVRTARAYAFLLQVLESSLGPEILQSLHGLRQGGQREDDLLTELKFMRDMFYGLYLISAEDIGMRPLILDDEPVDQPHCYQTAADWLSNAFDDPDLAVDTRAAVPILVDFQRHVTRVWMTLGVRLTRLESSFVKAPRIKPVKGDYEWETVQPSRLEMSKYLIPVDEFAEVEMRGRVALTREELRQLCDQHETREAILAALRGQSE